MLQGRQKVGWELQGESRESSAKAGRAPDKQAKLMVPRREGFPHHLRLAGGQHNKYNIVLKFSFCPFLL